MAVYAIVETDIHNPEAYEEYKAKAGPLVKAAGGNYLVRGGPHKVVEGDWDPVRLVVLEFADQAAFDKWYYSPEYQEALKIRQANATSKMVVVQGA